MPAQDRRAIVFVVDDEPVIAQTAAMILRSGGFDARAFTDPIAALEAARIDAPSLLLADMYMPRLNGFELSAALVENCPQCKVLLLSGDSGIRQGSPLTRAEMKWDLLNKPIQPSDLLKAIRGKLDS